MAQTLFQNSAECSGIRQCDPTTACGVVVIQTMFLEISHLWKQNCTNLSFLQVSNFLLHDQQDLFEGIRGLRRGLCVGFRRGRRHPSTATTRNEFTWFFSSGSQSGHNNKRWRLKKDRQLTIIWGKENTSKVRKMTNCDLLLPFLLGKIHWKQLLGDKKLFLEQQLLGGEAAIWRKQVLFSPNFRRIADSVYNSDSKTRM